MTRPSAVPNPATSANYSALGPDGAGFGRDGSHEGDFEFQGCRADAFVERRLDREAHAGVEHGCTFCRSCDLALPCPRYRRTIRSPISDHAFYPQIAFSIGAPGSLRSVLPQIEARAFVTLESLGNTG